MNMTNHAYFNLSGGLKTNIYDHVAQVCAQWYLPVDDTQVRQLASADTQGNTMH